MTEVNSCCHLNFVFWLFNFSLRSFICSRCYLWQPGRMWGLFLVAVQRLTVITPAFFHAFPKIMWVTAAASGGVRCGRDEDGQVKRSFNIHAVALSALQQAPLPLPSVSTSLFSFLSMLGIPSTPQPLPHSTRWHGDLERHQGSRREAEVPLITNSGAALFNHKQDNYKVRSVSLMLLAWKPVAGIHLPDLKD